MPKNAIKSRVGGSECERFERQGRSKSNGSTFPFHKELYFSMESQNHTTINLQRAGREKYTEEGVKLTRRRTNKSHALFSCTLQESEVEEVRQ